MRIHLKSERGQAAILVTLLLFVLMGMLGLLVDLGWGYFRKQAELAAAEAAALAAVEMALENSSTITCGSNHVTCPSTPTACSSTALASPPPAGSTNIQIGCAYAYLNGFIPGGNGGTQNVTMVAGDKFGNGAGINPPTASKTLSPVPDYWVTVRVADVLPQLFSAVLGHNQLLSSARATAAVVYVVPTGCIFVLDTNADTGLLVSGSGDIEVPNCGVYVNAFGSGGSAAVTVSGSGKINASAISVFYSPLEGTCNSSPCNVTTPTGSNYTGAVPVNTATQVSDPLASTPTPSYTSCTTATQSSCCANWDSVQRKLITSYSGTLTLSPGVYCGGVTVSGTANVTFSSGNYILLGGQLTLSGGNVQAQGNNVLFYGTGTNPPAPNTPSTNDFQFSGTVNIQGGALATLTAPSTGSQPNILFFEDPRFTSGSNNDKIAGGSSMALTGIVYLPHSTLDLSAAGAQSNNNLAVVANKLTCQGSCSLGSPDFITGVGAGSSRVVTLIE